MSVTFPDERLREAIEGAQPAGEWLAARDPVGATASLTAGDAVRLFEAMLTSRALDVAARRLRERGVGFYTIASAGHEPNAVVGTATRPTDPALLHYRSGAFMVARAQQVAGSDPIGDTIRSLVASREDPIAQGRHKVWGSRALWVAPQTSTIASHLPKAVGAAFALERRARIGLDPDGPDLPVDAVVVCSFGDASANHAAALAAVNAARWSHRRGSPVPILFVCEDNGLGISVDTPPGWIAESFGGLAHLRYVCAEGHLDEVHAQVAAAVADCRARRAPVFLHLPTVRLWGHAGSDVETAYRSREAIEADERRDPLPLAARRLITLGAARPEQLGELVEQVRGAVDAEVGAAPSLPRLASRAEIVAPLAPYDEAAVRAAAARPVDEAARRRHFGGTPPEEQSGSVRRTLASHLNAALHDELLARPEVVVFGEDVGRKGGVYHLTAGLQEAFGSQRVFDTLLDETTILGVAQGVGLLGGLPIPEIQYLAYVHNALDQIRGEAASTSFFSSGQFTTPMVVRVAAFAYQKGFGGHFHNDNAIGALRDIPGCVLAAPARSDDAARMLRGSTAIARAHGRVVVLLEPIALYHERDLYADGDGGWLTDYPPPPDLLLPGEVGTYGPADAELAVLTYANGVRLSLRAARELADAHGIRARVVDLRWLNPLPWAAIEAVARAGRGVLVVDECRATGGGIADAVIAHLAEGGHTGPMASVRAADSYVPLGPLAEHVLVSEAEIVEAGHHLMGGR